MLVHLVVIIAVLAVLSSARLHSHAAEEVVFEDKALAANLVKQLDARIASKLKPSSQRKIFPDKDTKGVRKVSKKAVASVGAGYIVQSSKPNSDCTGVSSEYFAAKLNTCIEGYMLDCTQDGVLTLTQYDNNDCSGSPDVYQGNYDSCVLDEDTFKVGMGIRKLRSRCVAAADMPDPTPGVKQTEYTDAACTQEVAYQITPFGSCQIFFAGGVYHYIRLSGVTQDQKRKFHMFSDPNCVHAQGIYIEDTPLDYTCNQIDEGVYIKATVINV